MQRQGVEEKKKELAKEEQVSINNGMQSTVLLEYLTTSVSSSYKMLQLLKLTSYWLSNRVN